MMKDVTSPLDAHNVLIIKVPKRHTHRLFKSIFIIKLMICQVYDWYIWKSQCIFDSPWPRDSVVIDEKWLTDSS